MAHPAETSRIVHLRRLLESYRPSDESEAEYRARMTALLDAEQDPFERTSYVPGHFTASAFVLSPERSELLLIHHAKLNRWLQPGGHVEPTDADVIAAARREVTEETGVNCSTTPAQLFDIDIHRIPARPDAQAHEHFDVRFLFIAPDSSFEAGSDALAARWTPLGDVAQLESDESVLRAVRKLRARLA